MIGINNLKAALKQDKVLIGTFIRCCDPAVVETIAYAGFDFIIIDNEHTAMDASAMVNLIRAAELCGIGAVVRINAISADRIQTVLDAGALGVQVPQVDTPEQAAGIVRWSKYAPLGERGFAASQRACGYGRMDALEYARLANEQTMVIGYCETAACVGNLDAILQTEGLDVIFMGPFDLSQSFGVLGQTDHPKVISVMEEVIGKTRAAGKSAGTIAANPQQAKRWIEKGARFIALSSDLGLMSAMGAAMLSQLRGDEAINASISNKRGG